MLPHPAFLRRNFVALLAALAICGVPALRAQDDAALRLAPHLDALLGIVKGKTDVFTLKTEAEVPGVAGKITVTFGRDGAQRFFLSFEGLKDVQGSIVYTPERAFIDLPLKNTVLLAEGAVPPGTEALAPHALFKSALRLHPIAEALWPVIEKGDGVALAGALSPNIKAEYAEVEKSEKGVTYLTLKPGKPEISLALKAGQWVASWRDKPGAPKPSQVAVSLTASCTIPAYPADRKIVQVSRADMERTLQRGSARAVEIKVEDWNTGALPADKVTEIPGARLEIKNGQRTCWLTGTPYEIGKAHGQLLKDDMRKVTDSTLYVVGLVYSVKKGSWFMNDIRDAWKRLEPHCDKEHLDELRGLADGTGFAYEEVKIANIFPELFHCSGFAVSGDATVGGKLYHGRVLDYMTEIGLQNVQVDFITKRDGCRGYVNIGYAGFVGCVSGMNDAQISLGEMGGRGEGNWDGTPMAFLMRRVLEKAETLEQARDIFAKAKRTCEYYYVIGDGKTRSALGVAAWPEKIEFIQQGQAHAQLPDAYAGCVLLSAGDRYKLLSERTKKGFGKLDERGAIELMNRPVSMGSNLHSVLFVPEDQTYHVAHASPKGHQPAAGQKYVKHDLKENLKKLEDVKNGKVTSAK